MDDSLAILDRHDPHLETKYSLSACGLITPTKGKLRFQASKESLVVPVCARFVPGGLEEVPVRSRSRAAQAFGNAMSPLLVYISRHLGTAGGVACLNEQRFSIAGNRFT